MGRVFNNPKFADAARLAPFPENNSFAKKKREKVRQSIKPIKEGKEMNN